MNASLVSLALLLAPGMAAADAQHQRLLDSPAPTLPVEAMPAARHVQAEHLAEVSLEPAASPGTANPAPPPPRPAATHAVARSAPPGQVGQATRRLLQLQASGEAGAPLLPMLGAPANAAYKRHLDSFSHPIPEYFDTAVPTSSTPR